MISVLIVEDEPPAARRLARLAQEILGASAAQTSHAATLRDALKQLSAGTFDIICLDLNLAGNDGFKALSHGAAKGAAVIVVSAHLERAVEGFEHGVVDFVPKPVSAERFATALTRATEALKKDAGPRLAVRRPGGVEMVPVAEIISISGAGDYAEIITRSGKTYLDDRNLSELEELMAEYLLRVHRSHLVNLKFVRKLTKEDAQMMVELEGDVMVPVARRAVAKVTAALPNLT